MGLFSRMLFSNEQKEWGLLKTTLLGAVSIFIENTHKLETAQNLSTSLTQIFVEYSKHTNRTFSPEMIEDVSNFFVALEMASNTEKECFSDLVKLYFHYQSNGKQVDEWRNVDKKLNHFFAEHSSKIGLKCF